LTFRDVPSVAYRVIVPAMLRLPAIAHVPHASTVIPEAIRASIVLDDSELQRELVRMTDWHVDRLFGWIVRSGASMFVNDASRLVVDPERFRDDAGEPMAAVGQGAVYTRTTQGAALRRLTAGERALYLERYYDPYHEALTELVSSILEEFDVCTVLDCHSFSTEPLPNEHDQAPNRPDICIGTDAYHTPPAVADALERAFGEAGFRVQRNAPFAGSLVPIDYYQRDRRVTSVMLEVRRGLYCDETTGQILPAFDNVRGAIERALVGSGILDSPSGMEA
jgi:N-formylglutamate deformylase